MGGRQVRCGGGGGGSRAAVVVGGGRQVGGRRWKMGSRCSGRRGVVLPCPVGVVSRLSSPFQRLAEFTYIQLQQSL